MDWDKSNAYCKMIWRAQTNLYQLKFFIYLVKLNINSLQYSSVIYKEGNNLKDLRAESKGLK